MSATNRGGERHARDYYPSPSWTVHRLLEACPLPGGRWLEPCVGDGAIVRAVNEVRSDVEWITCDIRPECEAVLDERGVRRHWVGDFLDPVAVPIDSVDVVLTNPPFGISRAFATRCLAIAPVVAFLLRLNWLRGTDEHNAWLREHMPAPKVLPQRPSFDGRGTDATEYAWMVWGMGPPIVAMLADTPDEVRKSSNLDLRRRDFAVGSLFDEVDGDQLPLLGGSR